MDTMTEEEYDAQWELEWLEYQASKESHYEDEVLTMCENILEAITAEIDDEKRADLIYQAHELCDHLGIDSTWIPALNE